MPSFVCDTCQETLKKAKLDQHAQRCRKAVFSCIDCYKTFKGTEYRAHTSCITEVEKYHKIKPKEKPATLVVATKPIVPAKEEKKEEPKKPKTLTPKDVLLAALSRDDKSLRSVFKTIKKGKEEKALRKDTKKWILENLQISLDANGNPVINLHK